MTHLDAAIVRRKLRRIRANLETLRKVVGNLSAEGYASDELRRRAVERLLQETIDAAVDVNAHLLRGAGLVPPEDYYSSFIDLGAAGIIDGTLARSLAPSAGLRNRIVHQYEELDDGMILAAAQQAPDRFREYLASIELYLGRRGL